MVGGWIDPTVHWYSCCRPHPVAEASLQAAEQQRRLIDAAVGLLRPGGHMVYSTCTINPGADAHWTMHYMQSVAPCTKALHHTASKDRGASLLGQASLSVIILSIHTGENEANVRYALDTHPSLELVPHKPYIGGAGLVGPCESAAAAVQKPAPGDAMAAAPATAGQQAARLVGRGLSEAEARLVQRFDPAGPRDTPGFFIAKFRKRQ